MKDQCRECYWSFYCPEKSRGIACTKYKGPLRNGNSDKGAKVNNPNKSYPKEGEKSRS